MLRVRITIKRANRTDPSLQVANAPITCFSYRSSEEISFLFQTDTFAAVYKKLTGKEVTFEFPEPYL